MAEKLIESYEFDVTTIPGNRGEYSVWLYLETDSSTQKTSSEPKSEAELIIEKTSKNFPTNEEVITALDLFLDTIS